MIFSTYSAVPNYLKVVSHYFSILCAYYTRIYRMARIYHIIYYYVMCVYNIKSVPTSYKIYLNADLDINKCDTV